jgi:hypothetical protein
MLNLQEFEGNIKNKHLRNMENEDERGDERDKSSVARCLVGSGGRVVHVGHQADVRCL